MYPLGNVDEADEEKHLKHRVKNGCLDGFLVKVKNGCILVNIGQQERLANGQKINFPCGNAIKRIFIDFRFEQKKTFVVFNM